MTARKNWILPWAKFLEKHLWLYFLLECTWGILSNALGALICLFFLCLGHKPHLFRHFVYTQFSLFGDDNWGGFEMGVFFFCCPNTDDGLNGHEAGHSYQIALFGPLYWFVIGIPSVIRYWVFVIREKHGKSNPDYDSIWFEFQATNTGYELFLAPKQAK